MALTGIGSNYDLLELQKLQQQNGQTTGAQKYDASNPIQFNGNEDNSTKSLEEIEESYTEAEEAASGSQATQAAAGSSSVNGTSSTGASSGASSEKIKEEIEELEEEKEENIKKMEKIEDEIEDLTEAAEKNIMEAAKAQESAVKEHEEETQKAVEENINAYVEANKEGGEGMTREELQKNIKGSLADVPEVADAVSALVEANEQINEVDSLLGDLNSLILDTQSIDQELEAKQGEYEAAVKAEEEAKCCDPIGFTATDADGNEAQYDFIVDDGNFDSTSDFLGASSQWADMQALDTDGDNTVTAAELQAGNIKAVKTNADGSQEIVDLAEEFGDDFSIDLNSYKEGGSHSAVNTTSDSDGDGTADQQMLGTFNINANGQTISGYNTLDDTDWLAENYGLSADSSVSDTDSFEYSQDLQPHVNFFNTYTQKVQELKSSLEGAWESLGLSKESMQNFNESAVKEANQKAQNFFTSLGIDEENNEEGNEGENNEGEQNGITTNTIDTMDNANAASMTPEEIEKLREEELIAA